MSTNRYRQSTLRSACSGLGIRAALAAFGVVGTGVTSAMAQSVDAGTVSATATSVDANAGFSGVVLSKKAVQHETQSVTTISKAETSLFTPQTSGLQTLTIKPGISINGYNATSGTARSTVSMRGVKVGWNSVPGDLETNGVTVMLDGIPLNSLIQGTGWHSTEIPMGTLLSGTNIIFGPGNPRDRWYDSLGGTINFIPVQPTVRPEAGISASYGSNDQKNVSLYASSGVHDGWSSVLGYAYGDGNTFRTGGYNDPAHAAQLYAKVRKDFTGGHISIGAYWQHSTEQRPNDIPVNPIAGVTVAGLNVAGAQLYSQQTSGFYSDLPKSVWFKKNQIQNYIGYIKFFDQLDDSTSVTNLTWYRHGEVIHYRVNPGFQAASLNDSEFYNPHSDTIGDKLSFDTKLPYNTISYGGYVIASHTVDSYRGYQALSYAGSTPSSQLQPYQATQGIYDNLFAAAFLQDDISPIPGLHIVPGIQLVNYGTSFYNNNASYALQFPPQQAGNTNPSVNKDFQRPEFSVGASYDIFPWLTPYGNFAVTYQNPTGGVFNNAQTDLPALKPVKSTDYEIGIRMLQDNFMGFDEVSGALGYYHDVLSDQTIPISLASQPNVTSFGYGSAILQGVNAEFDGKMNFNWEFFANAGYFDGHYTSYFSPGSGTYYNGVPVSNTPTLTGNIGFTYQRFVGENLLKASVFDQYFGHSYMFNNLIQAPTTQKIQAYNLVNFNITMSTPYFNHIVPGLGDLTFGVSGSNILDRHYNSTEYVSSGGYFGGAGAGSVIANPGQGRAIYGTVSMKF
ncbi:TonB-dependent receptor [Acidocella sp.]|uniref:TonB-dependent receptor n=1 Tax=Acidocella sp. TaxID=50710 RepID=UPI002622AB10|nr:TonB-dependent receptor [Acidocella sp.]